MKAKEIKRLRREVKRLRAELDHVHEVAHGHDCSWWFERMEAEILPSVQQAIEESTARLRAQAERDAVLDAYDPHGRQRAIKVLDAYDPGG